MLRSMFAGVSGLRSHQTMMDVVGNNIANVNTVGYKSSRATFQDALAQVVRGASTLSDARGGTNPMQVGLGAQVASIDLVLGQGSVQLTGRSTDLAIQGEGYFVTSIGGQQLYTRAGALTVDGGGGLVGPSGGRIMGWMADGNGAIDSQQPVEELVLPTGQIIEPVPTSEIVVGGNLPASAPANTGTAAAPVPANSVVNTSITVYDTLGQPQEMSFRFSKTATANEWELYRTSGPGTGGGPVLVPGGPLTFDVDGTLLTPAPGVLTMSFAAGDFPGAGAQDIDLVLNRAGEELVQFGDTATAMSRSQDGVEMGFMRGFEFGTDGTITGRFSNGTSLVLGAIAVATFNNPAGLSRQGENIYGTSPNSGIAFVGRPGDGDAGVLAPGSLEMSNVDLANEFTNLIIAQRGFQANSRSITASDEILADIVNLKR